MATHTTSVRVAIEETVAIEISIRPEAPIVDKVEPFRTIYLFAPCHLYRAGPGPFDQEREQSPELWLAAQAFATLPEKPYKKPVNLADPAGCEKNRNAAPKAPIHQLERWMIPCG